MIANLSAMALAAAEILPDPQSFQAIGWTVVILGALITGLNQALKFADRFKPPRTRENLIQPQPLMVSQAPEPVSVKAFQDHVLRSADERKEIFNKLDDLNDGIAVRVEALRQETKNDFIGVHQRMNIIAEKMPREVIELLKTTGAIK